MTICQLDEKLLSNYFFSMAEHTRARYQGNINFWLMKVVFRFQRKIKFPRENARVLGYGCDIYNGNATDMLLLFTDGGGSKHNVIERDTKRRWGGWRLRTLRPTTWNVYSTCGILINPGGRRNWKWNPGVYSVVRRQHEKCAQHIRALSCFGRSFGKRNAEYFV